MSIKSGQNSEINNHIGVNNVNYKMMSLNNPSLSKYVCVDGANKLVNLREGSEILDLGNEKEVCFQGADFSNISNLKGTYYRLDCSYAVNLHGALDLSDTKRFYFIGADLSKIDEIKWSKNRFIMYGGKNLNIGIDLSNTKSACFVGTDLSKTKGIKWPIESVALFDMSLPNNLEWGRLKSVTLRWIDMSGMVITELPAEKFEMGAVKNLSGILDLSGTKNALIIDTDLSNVSEIKGSSECFSLIGKNKSSAEKRNRNIFKKNKKRTVLDLGNTKKAVINNADLAQFRKIKWPKDECVIGNDCVWSPRMRRSYNKWNKKRQQNEPAGNLKTALIMKYQTLCKMMLKSR